MTKIVLSLSIDFKMSRAKDTNTFAFTLPTGEVETRNSRRTFTHVVVAYWPHNGDTSADAGVFSWHASAKAAAKAASTYRGRGAAILSISPVDAPAANAWRVVLSTAGHGVCEMGTHTDRADAVRQANACATFGKVEILAA